VECFLFSDAKSSRPYRVDLPKVFDLLDHYKVRCFLLSLDWEEYVDWMISPYVVSEPGEYHVWFADIGKATYFKLSFDL